MKVKTMLVAATAMLLASTSAPAQNSISEADTLSLAVGTSFGHDIGIQLQRLRSLGLNVDLNVFMRAVEAELNGRSSGMSVSDATAWLDHYIASSRPSELPDVFTPQSQQAFLDSVASLPGAVRYPDGLIMIVELEGEGPMPVDSDRVRVMYTGRFSDGIEFDATTQPIEFGVTEVTPGFSEGLKMMRPGGRYRIVMPATLAYGSEGIPGAVPGNAALDFTVDLVGINH